MTRCDEGLIPPLWAQLHRYDATKGYEAARDGLLHAVGLLKTAVKAATQTAEFVDLVELSVVNIARLKALEDFLSLRLSPRQFEDAVILMLKGEWLTFALSA